MGIIKRHPIASFLKENIFVNCLLLFTILSSFLLVSEVKAETFVKEPEFSVPAGLYTEEFDLSITSDNAAKIYYTIDGSEPKVGATTTHEYTIPLPITAQGLREKESGYFFGTVIRAVAITSDGTSSKITTASYFVDANIFTRYGLPIISIVTDSTNLYDTKTGIMSPANTQKKGIEWERPFHFEYFDTDGKEQLSLDAGIRLHGGASRDWVYKAFRIYARSEYDKDDKFDYNFFKDSMIPSIVHNGDNNGEVITEFKRLILRNGGNEGTAWDGTFIRDTLSQALMENTTLDLQAYAPAITFLNGEFYGIHNIQERQDEKYLEDHYNIDEEQVAIFDFWYDDVGAMQVDVVKGDDTDLNYYRKIIDFIKNNDLSLSKNYEQIKQWFDIENYVDYQVINLFGANGDWPGNNCRAWRAKTEYDPEAEYGLDGKIRWLVYDQDFNFGLYDMSKVNLNSLNDATKVGGIRWPNSDGATMMFRKLLENEEFKSYFCQRYLDLLNTNFVPSYTTALVDLMAAPYRASIDEFRDRHRKIGNYDENIENVKSFLMNRVSNCKTQLATRFQLGKFYFLALNTGTEDGTTIGGKVQVNTVTIDSTANGITDGIWKQSYYDALPVMLTAIPEEGYRFVGWSGATDLKDATINASELALTGNNNIELKPMFELKPIEVTDTVNQDSDNTQTEAASAFNNQSQASTNQNQADNQSNDQWMYLVSILILAVIIIIMAVYIIVRNKNEKSNNSNQ